ncbi:MAG: insulinase family protein [Candidatus Eisenbacteria bacterium]|nr:insulinase family protein [Candidatus Eisenbacteria bacterium]
MSVTTMIRRAPGRTALAWIAAFALCTMFAARGTADPIAARPEQLKFPPLTYAPPKAADYRVKLGNGIIAYLVPDRDLPLTTVHVLMRVGPDLDPAGKEGLAAMTVYLLTRGGTSTRTATQIEDRVAFLGAQLESQQGGGGGGFGGGGVPIGASESRATLNLLSKDVDEGLALLADCLQHPAFQDDRITLRRDQQMQAMKQRNDESAQIEDREFGFLMRGDGHWSNRYPTETSIKSITRDDLVAFHKRYVGAKNFILAVSGDFDRAAMVRKLEATFGKWPSAGERPAAPAAPTTAAASGYFMVDKAVNQGRVSVAITGIQRDDPDLYAMRVMNDILGGGGFTSRLVNRIRSDEGLAYQVGSRLGEGVYYPEPWRLIFQSKVRSVAFALQIAFGEIGRMRDSLVTNDEIETSKNGFAEAFPTQFATAGAIAGQLAVDELTGRYAKHPSYWAEYRDKIRAVTAADVQRVARRLLDPAKMAVVMVGDAKEMTLGDPKHASATLASLSSGGMKHLPLRDPMTMKPMPTP